MISNMNSNMNKRLSSNISVKLNLNSEDSFAMNIHERW